MKWRALVVALTMAIASHADADDQATWTVQSGDVLSAIALRAGVSVDDVRRWNGIEGDRILVGQELRLAGVPTPVPSGPPHRVARGETLSRIAARAGITTEAIVAANPGLDPNRIRAGQEIVIPDGRKRLEHEVRRGERLADLARRYEVSTRELRQWNPELRRGLQAGLVLVVYTDVPPSRSRSIGATNGGSLVDAEPLTAHPGYIIRDPRRSYGTIETITWIREAFDAVVEAHPTAPRLRVHDISYREGGPIIHHRSHQSGRDVDMSYYFKRCGEVCRMGNIHAGLIDPEPQWTLFKAWLDRGVVEAIFVDYELQAPLYEYARAQGATRAQLHRWFQYPRGPTYPLGTIRHFPKHRDHAHVRFICPDTDEECVGR